MVTAKVFAQGQSWSAMLGYIQKDFGQATYQIVTHDVTDDEVTTPHPDIILLMLTILA